ncbi:putative methyltransferase nsun7 [Blyttiomyces sp. JEL0837]|nr:putative methyltransferase nsun7 [Blyttiomyces sp. JEL0837]
MSSSTGLSFNRVYQSDTSLYLDANKTAASRAANARPLFGAQSEPALSNRKPHPLLDEDISTAYTYSELLLGAETLENIVAEGVYMGATLRRFRSETGDRPKSGREMTDKVLRLVYGTMKYLPYIDTILVKTQFLVYNNQFLNHLGLVKVVLYNLMKCHFEFQKFPNIDYSGAEAPASKEEKYRAEIVHDLDESLRKFEVKLAAAYARIRIERRAVGDTFQEQMENILPEDVRAKETIAVEMPKTVRINTLKTTKEQAMDELRKAGYRVRLTLQPYETASEDKASAYGVKHIATLLEDGGEVIDTRAGCDVDVIDSDFITSDATDPTFNRVTTIIVEPPNSGTAIVDKLGYMLQEEEFPNDLYSQKDLAQLRRQQSNMLKHAFEFPNVQNIVYLTRTTNPDENELLVHELLKNNEEHWELSCVLPDIINDQEYDWEIEECLKIAPSREGNGVFITCFTRKGEPKISAATVDETEARVQTEEDNDAHSDDGAAHRRRTAKVLGHDDASEETGAKKPKRLRKKRHAHPSGPKLSKTLSESVSRLSVPRRNFNEEDLTAEKKTKPERALKRHDSKHSGATEHEGANDEEGDFAKVKNSGSQSLLDFDIGVFGISLKRFYEPKAKAIKQIEISPPDVARWRYPVPNPRPWK